jgi:cystathionine beta-synthase
MMQDTILQSIGHTPLVRIRRLSEGLEATIAAKVESMNPGGSIKDRVALAMIAEAEKRGWLRPGGTIIEATAGNTGVGLAMVAAVRGYRCIFVLPDKMSSEKISLLKAYGAEVVITPTAVAPDSPESYNGVADRLSREIPGAWRPNQFTNLANPEMHYRTTGPEIWNDTEGKITVLVGGVGTGGTLSGAAKYLKERNSDIKVIGADPEGSVLSGGMPRPWKVEGIGEDFVPKTFNSQLVDDWVQVSDSESFHIARELARREGILVGGSSGTAMAAALRYARRLKASDLVVVLCADTGRNYMSKAFDDRWMAENKLQWVLDVPHSVGDLLQKRGERPLVTVSPTDPASNAIGIFEKSSISQLPVLENGKPVGSVLEVTIARLLHDQRDPSRVPIGEIMAKPLPTLDIKTHLDEAYRLLLAGHTGVLATSDGHAVGIVTRIDLIQYWQGLRGKETS